MHERNPRLRVAPGAHPTFDRDRHVLRRLAGEDLMPAELSLVHRSYRIDGVPGRTRTCDPQFRRLLLYPPALRGHQWLKFCRGRVQADNDARDPESAVTPQPIPIFRDTREEHGRTEIHALPSSRMRAAGRPNLI